MATTRVQTALKFFKSYDQLSIEILEDILTPNFQHFFAPATPPRPPLDKTAYKAHASKVKEIMVGFPVIPKEIMQDAEKNQVIIRANGYTNFREEVMDAEMPAEEWKYEGEYIFILSIDESGKKIERIIEFVDSKGTDRLRVLMQKANQ